MGDSGFLLPCSEQCCGSLSDLSCRLEESRNGRGMAGKIVTGPERASSQISLRDRAHGKIL